MSRGSATVALAMGMALALAITACRDTPTGPTVRIDAQFTLAPGQTAVVEGTELRVQFIAVTDDSRCPADVVCIQAGDAIVRIHAIASTTADYELHTAGANLASVTHEGLTITLKEVQPYPFNSRPPIQPGDYRVTLIVSR